MWFFSEWLNFVNDTDYIQTLYFWSFKIGADSGTRRQSTSKYHIHLNIFCVQQCYHILYVA